MKSNVTYRVGDLGEVLLALRKDEAGILEDDDGDKIADGKTVPLQVDEEGYLRIIPRGELVNYQRQSPVQDEQNRRLLELILANLIEIKDALASKA